MNLCIFTIERHQSLLNEDYTPNRLQHIQEVIETVINTNYFNYISIILSDMETTVLLPPSSKKSIITELSSIKFTETKTHIFRSLRKCLFVSQMRNWDSIHLISFISTDQALSDIVLRRNELSTIKNWYVNFVLLGDILTPTNHTKTLISSLVKRQGRTWRITTVEPEKENPYFRFLLRLSEGIILPKKKVKQTFTPLRAGQHPSEFKASKYISCKILNYQTKDGVQMIPVPIISKEKTIASIRCGRCTIENGKCISSPHIGKLYLIEYSPILFKLIFKNEFVMESISILNGEIEHNVIYKNNREFLIIGGILGVEKVKQNIYWTIDEAKPFLEILDEVILQEAPESYLKIMESIWNEHKSTLNRMEEKFLAMKKEKENAIAKNGINTMNSMNDLNELNSLNNMNGINEMNDNHNEKEMKEIKDKVDENSNDNQQSKEKDLVVVEKNEKSD